MAVVILNNQTKGHIVNKYNFKVLALGTTEERVQEEALHVESMPTNVIEESVVHENEISTQGRDELVESLLKKADDMSSNFIKMQMKIEAQDEEHKLALEKVKEENFNLGIEEGKRRLQEELQGAQTNALEQFSQSIMSLNEANKEFQVALQNIEADLVHAALDIAKEVVDCEISEHSSTIAASLASGLIKELQDASKVTLKVNPNDHGEVSKRLGSLSHVEIVSDSAVSAGGVIVMSSAGNIDAEIQKRFERVKKSALAQ